MKLITATCIGAGRLYKNKEGDPTHVGAKMRNGTTGEFWLNADDDTPGAKAILNLKPDDTRVVLTKEYYAGKGQDKVKKIRHILLTGELRVIFSIFQGLKTDAQGAISDDMLFSAACAVYQKHGN